MISLVGTILLIIAAFFLSKSYPFAAGFIAVIPIKIVATSLFAHDVGNLEPAIRGMLIGQFLWGFMLLVTWYWIKPV